MKKYVIAVHYINGEGSLKDFKEGLKDFEKMREISRGPRYEKYELKFGLRLQVDEVVSQNLKQEVKELRTQLSQDLWLLYDPLPGGSGIAQRQVLFNPSFWDSISIYYCLDQFVIGLEECVARTADLAQRVETNNVLYASGSRKGRVILGEHERNSNLRIIHELYHSLTIGSDRLRVEEKIPGVTPAYAEIGESTTGVDMVNQTHPKYPELAKSLYKAIQDADMTGFATPYYTAIKSALLEPVNFANGYVASKENPFYKGRSEEEEFDYVTQKIIGYQTEQLGKTDIGDALFAAVRAEENTDKISEFYNREDVELVRDLMIENLS